VAVQCFPFFILTRLLGNGWLPGTFTKSLPDVFAVLFANGGNPMKIGPPKKLGPKKSIFERKFRLRRLCTAHALRRRGEILEKLKQLVGL